MSSEPVVSKIRPSLDVLHFPKSHLAARGTQCPNCTWFLTVIQPDTSLPLRLIGACESCKRWYLIDSTFDASEGIMLTLPDGQVIRNLSRENPSPGISLLIEDKDDA